MCPNKDLDKKDKGYMTFELFRKIIDEAKEFIHEANLIHRGESLLHPEFFEMIRYAADAGIVTKLHTNGTLLDETKARALLGSGLDQLTFSFDGYDKATYESIRINGRYEKTIGNILGFLKLKKELGARKPFTILELIDFPEVYKDVGRAEKKKFLGQFDGLPLDRIRVKEMHNWAGEVGSGAKGRKYSLARSFGLRSSFSGTGRSSPAPRISSATWPSATSRTQRSPRSGTTVAWSNFAKRRPEEKSRTSNPAPPVTGPGGTGFWESPGNMSGNSFSRGCRRSIWRGNPLRSLPPFLGRGMNPRPATKGAYPLGSPDERPGCLSPGIFR